MSRVYSQTIYAMNTKDTSTKIFEFSWKWILLIKPHMRNRITVGGLSSNLEESIRVYTLINLERSIPHLQIMVKHKYVEYARKKSTVQVTKRRLTLWVKHVVVNVIIIYVGSIRLSFVKHALKTSKTTT